jgi:hypothetical protein
MDNKNEIAKEIKGEETSLRYPHATSENGKPIRSEKLIPETDIPDFAVRHQNLNLTVPVRMWM